MASFTVTLKDGLQQWPCNVCQMCRGEAEIDEQTHNTAWDIPSELTHDRTKIERKGKDREEEFEGSHLVS